MSDAAWTASRARGSCLGLGVATTLRRCTKMKSSLRSKKERDDKAPSVGVQCTDPAKATASNKGSGTLCISNVGQWMSGCWG